MRENLLGTVFKNGVLPFNGNCLFHLPHHINFRTHPCTNKGMLQRPAAESGQRQR